jgi:iron complex outermembrane recepter protein
MYKKFCSSVGLSFFTVMAIAQTSETGAAASDSISNADQTEVVNILGLRANSKTPMAFENIGCEKIKALNTGQDLPYLLRFTPSLVVTSDAGTGIGYTGLWIRGSDPSRINVTVNGIPLNDPESQQVFWVNMPDFASTTQSIQIQRGVGSSTNGAGSFGGSINIESAQRGLKPYAEVNNSVGTFSSAKNSIIAGTGLINEHYSIDMRISNIQSKGYIDRASSKLNSFYTCGTYRDSVNVIKAIVFGGYERTYQSWWGTPSSRLNNDYPGMIEHAANNGLDSAQTSNLLQSGRTYNYYQYPNQVDDYHQNHYQLHASHYFKKATFNLALHYTSGKGYYEEFKSNQLFNRYGLQNKILANTNLLGTDVSEDGRVYNAVFQNQFVNPDISFQYNYLLGQNGDTLLDPDTQLHMLNGTALIDRTDLVRRRWLDNHFYGVVGSLSIPKKWADITIGGAWNIYQGNHFGEIIWMQYADDGFTNERYYRGKSTKSDANVYAKLISTVKSKLDLYVDLQVRGVNYRTDGSDNDLRPYDVAKNFLFFNPKAGASLRINAKKRLFGSVAIGNKEPNRNDFVDRFPRVPLSEKVYDIELGYQQSMGKISFNLNAYNMIYHNQLIISGALNDVGAPVRINVPKSYRRGIEVQVNWQVLDQLFWTWNGTLSQNRITSFEETIADYSVGYEEVKINHWQTDIAMSPAIIGSSQLEWNLLKNFRTIPESGNRELKSKLTLACLSKYVGKQFLDNTSNKDLMIDAYFVNDLRMEYVLCSKLGAQWSLGLVAQNVLNALYSSNGYTYSYIYGQRVTEKFYYPQAGRNFMVSLNIKV